MEWNILVISIPFHSILEHNIFEIYKADFVCTLSSRKLTPLNTFDDTGIRYYSINSVTLGTTRLSAFSIHITNLFISLGNIFMLHWLTLMIIVLPNTGLFSILFLNL